ncbi:MAG: NUDIX domain-containing protein [Gammaproteobacteria bacterium]|nr:NUDIX domain-containing protein [Gammaproteobacteria bacterium]
MTDPQQIEMVEKKPCYSGFFRLYRCRVRHTLFAGGWSDELVRELIDRGQGVAVLLYDPVLDRVVLIEQFRIGAIGAECGPWLVEIVGGMVEPGESRRDVAQRETMEEAGCQLRDLIPIYDYFSSPASSCERIALYCGIVDASRAGGVYGLADEGEDIRVRVMDCDAALEQIGRGALASATPIIALQWLMLNRPRLREQWAGA